MDTFPLFNFFSFLGVKYAAGIIILAVIFSVATEAFSTNGSTSYSAIAANILAIAAMLLLIAFIVFVIYNVYIGERFQFLPLAASTSIILFGTSLVIAVRAALSDSSGFHVSQALLALVASLVIGAVFSAFVKVAQRFIST